MCFKRGWNGNQQLSCNWDWTRFVCLASISLFQPLMESSLMERRKSIETDLSAWRGGGGGKQRWAEELPPSNLKHDACGSQHGSSASSGWSWPVMKLRSRSYRAAGICPATKSRQRWPVFRVSWSGSSLSLRMTSSPQCAAFLQEGVVQREDDALNNIKLQQLCRLLWLLSMIIVPIFCPKSNSRQ